MNPEIIKPEQTEGEIKYPYWANCNYIDCPNTLILIIDSESAIVMEGRYRGDGLDIREEKLNVTTLPIGTKIIFTQE